jgi:hypothetical protein
VIGAFARQSLLLFPCPGATPDLPPHALQIPAPPCCPRQPDLGAGLGPGWVVLVRRTEPPAPPRRPAGSHPAAAAPASAFAAAPQPRPALGRNACAANAALRRPPPGTPPPFATVIKDARRIDGPLTFWQKDDKVWIELLPDQFDQPWLLSPKIKSGIGEAWVLGGLMACPSTARAGRSWWNSSASQPGAPAGAQHRHGGHTRLARGACRGRFVLAQPAGCGAGGQPAAPRPQERAGRSQPALPDRHAGHRHAAAARPAPGLWAGSRQLGHHRGARSDQAMVVETQNHFYTASVAVPCRVHRPVLRCRNCRASCPTRAACWCR